jgi:hypothetical protein
MDRAATTATLPRLSRKKGVPEEKGNRIRIVRAHVVQRRPDYDFADNRVLAEYVKRYLP